MFKKVLVAEDFDSINIGLAKALADLSIDTIEHAKYCDDALLKIKKALHDKEPFDLVISDLSFLPDGRQDRIKSGEQLIAEVKRLQPDIRIIVYSVEDRPARIKSLFDNHGISGYIFKGRSSITHLKNAILEVKDGSKTYISPELAHVFRDKSINEIDNYDVGLLKLLAEGLKQDEISKKLREEGISPNSISAIEKRISRLKVYFRANNNVQVVVMAKDLGFI
ncbi:MAG TPA: response regulator transcription factor [Flavobacterium sp.]|jgi:DNA-binding NarL/FixJ family response regulator